MQNAPTKPIKLQTVQGKEWVRFAYEDEYCVEITSAGTQRLCVTCSAGYVDLLLTLSAALAEPFFVLYVLVLSRKSDNLAARYQSREISRVELRSFFERFEDFFENDGRHHVWIHSPTSSATLVYDNHDVIYAYGPIEAFSEILQNNSFKLIQSPKAIGPHGHCYNPEFDADENEILKYWQWKQSPLQERDDSR